VDTNHDIPPALRKPAKPPFLPSFSPGYTSAAPLPSPLPAPADTRLRREARLLTPEEIREGREKLGLTQRQFANLLGVGEATVSRWETGAQIQQRAMDRFLRVCLASPAVAELLRSDFQTSRTGA